MNLQESSNILRQEAKDKLRNIFENSGYEVYLSGMGDTLDRIVDCIISVAILEVAILQNQIIEKIRND